MSVYRPTTSLRKFFPNKITDFQAKLQTPVFLLSREVTQYLKTPFTLRTATYATLYVVVGRHTAMYGDVVIEHVDLYGSVHTHTASPYVDGRNMLRCVHNCAHCQ